MQVGDYHEYRKTFDMVPASGGCLPATLPDVAVHAVDDELRRCLAAEGLGEPHHPTRTVRDIVAAILPPPPAAAARGTAPTAAAAAAAAGAAACLEGDRDTAFHAAADALAAALGVDLAELHRLRRRKAQNKTGTLRYFQTRRSGLLLSLF